jgi:hypothetical protein
MKTKLLLVLLPCFIAINLFSQTRPPEVPADDPYFLLGYLNVLLFNADNTGTRVCTAEIQAALNASQTYKLACYFPSGTYLIDNVITGKMPITRNKDDLQITNPRLPFYIVGDDIDRPIIKLVNNAPGYGEGTKKAMIRLMAYEESTGYEWSPIAFNIVLRNMIFDVNGSNGNRGAVGIRFAAAQGSAVEDVKVIATGAFAGFYNCTGQAGGSYNVEVEGGDYAFYIADDNSRFINMVGLVCKNQLIEVINVVETNRPMQIVGFHFVKESGPIMSGWPVFGTGVSLIDGIIEYTGTSANALPVPENGNLYIKDVYFKNCAKIIFNNNQTALDQVNWNRVTEYVYSTSSNNNLINGVTSGSPTLTPKIQMETPPEPTVLTRKHTWDPGTFVSIGMRSNSDFISVKDPLKMTGPNGTAKGNGTTVDSDALQWAIDRYNKVFLPSGTYIINKPLILKATTQLFGAGKTNTMIRPSSTWLSGFTKTMITTVADAEATTSISFLMLETDTKVHQDMNRIEWKAGRNSVIRDIMIGAVWSTTEASLNHYIMKITGPTGGGRIYSFSGENQLIKDLTNHPNYRNTLIENTKEPIRFYSYNTERVASDYQFEIKNSSNIVFYYFKAEATAAEGQGVPLYINNSDNIRVYCLSGNMTPRANRALLEVNNSTNIVAAIVRSNKTATTWYDVKEAYNSSTFTIPGDRSLCLFERNDYKWTGTSSDDWNTSSNWSSGAVPTSTSNVFIPNTSRKPVSNQTSSIPAVCNNLVIDNGAYLSVNSNKALTVNGMLTNNNHNGILGLQINSDASGTGSLIVKGSTSGLGAAKAERWMKAAKWNMVSAPVSGQTVSGFLADNSNIPTLPGNIRGMMDFNAASDSWGSYFIDGSDHGQLTAGRGFAMRLNGASDDQLIFNGAINSGSIVLPNLTSGAWNLVGNPYTSAIGINNLSSSVAKFIAANSANLDPSFGAIYVWETTDAENNNGQGTYTPVNNISGAYEIQQGQAFFVRMKAGGSSLNFSPEMQIHNSAVALKSAEMPLPSIKIVGNLGSLTSSSLIVFKAGMSKGLDPTYDAGMFKGDSKFNIYSNLVEGNNQIPFAIQSLPNDDFQSLKIPIGVDYTEGGELTISALTNHLPNDCNVILEDQLTNQFTDLLLKSYQVTLIPNSGISERFILHTSTKTTGLADSLHKDWLTAYVNKHNEIVINGTLGSEAIVSIYDLQGRLIFEENRYTGNQNLIRLTDISQGVYLLKIKDHGRNNSFKIIIH